MNDKSYKKINIDQTLFDLLMRGTSTSRLARTLTTSKCAIKQVEQGERDSTKRSCDSAERAAAAMATPEADAALGNQVCDRNS